MPGCSKQKTAVGNATINNPVMDSVNKKYLALGDSYTIGQSVSVNERFPYLIVEALRQNGVAVNDPQYLATTGWTTINLQQAIEAKSFNSHYDLVTLLIGVNDQYQGLDTAGYRVRFTQLLEKSIALAGNRSNHVIVLSIPDYSATPFVSENGKEKVSAEIKSFNSINKEVTLQYQIEYVDITPATLAASTDLSLVANDHLHYSGKEHKIWAEMVLPVALKILK